MPRSQPVAPSIRHRVDPGDVSPEKAARRMGLTPEQFEKHLPALKLRGFPDPDPTTGNYDLEAIDAWRALRRNTNVLTNTHSPGEPPPKRLGETFRAAKERRRHG